MTAGMRPSRRTERAAPLPVPLRATAASCLIAAMMMSFILSVAPCLQGCRIRRETLAYREARRPEQAWPAHRAPDAGWRFVWLSAVSLHEHVNPRLDRGFDVL